MVDGDDAQLLAKEEDDEVIWSMAIASPHLPVPPISVTTNPVLFPK